MTTQIESRRVILAAAILVTRYGNGDVAAYNRSYHAKTERARVFWHRVGRALGAAYIRHGCPTDYERATRRAIEAVTVRRTD